MRVKVSVIILLVSFLVGAASFLRINHSCETLINLTDDAIEIIKENNLKNSEDAIERIQVYYKRNLFFLNIFLNQNDIQSLQTSINMAYSLTHTKDCNSAILYLFEYKNALNGIIINNTPSVATIF